MSRLTAPERMRRVLAVVPWIAGHENGASLREACTRFGLTQAQLLADLDVVFLVGRYPFSPDELIDVVIEGDTVWLHYAEVFRRPLRLTPDEGLALVAACAALLGAPGAEQDGPLARGLAKLSQVLGVDPAGAVEVTLGQVAPGVLDVVRTGLREHRQIELDYYSSGRDERATRAVEPWQLWATDGNWYLSGYCHLAEAERVFRLDRVANARLLDVPAAPSPADALASASLEDPALPTVVLDLAPAHEWLAATVPARCIEQVGDRCHVTLSVSGQAWLERLLLQLGPDSSVLHQDPRLGTDDLRAVAARRVLGRYGV